MLYLSKINCILSSADTIYDLSMGDFNADASKVDHVGNIVHCFGRELMQYNNNEGLVISDCMYLDRTTTYAYVCSAKSSTSWLDHALCTARMNGLIKEVVVDYSTCVTSDHLPLSIVPGSD